MKKLNKGWVITILVAVGVLIFAIYLINKENSETPKEIAQCIGEKSTLYVQLGCPHCIKQENAFGENYKYLNVVDCYYDAKACIKSNITGTPTWVINGEKYIGFQSIEKLQELTGC